MRFDLVDLQLFVHVLDAGTITGGAARSHLALASASARLRGMEDSLGTSLLARSRRGVTATAAGSTLLHHARLVLQQAERMHGELNQYAAGVKARVRLLTNTAALNDFLPDVLATFLVAHPGIDIDLEERPSPRIARALADERAALGIVSDIVDLDALQARALRDDRLTVIVPDDHPLASRDAVDFATVLDYPAIGLGEDSALERNLADHAADLGRAIAYRIRLRGYDGICRTVAHGAGIAVVPEPVAERHAQRLPIRRLDLAEAWATRRLHLCARDFEALLPAAQLLANAISAGRGAALPAARRRRLVISAAWCS